MVKSELVRKLCDMHPLIRRRDMEKIISIITSEIVNALCRNQACDLRPLGRFKTVVRKARIGRNPKTGEKNIQIPEKIALRFKISKILYRRLNENKVLNTF